jgi:hypothetical protein
MAVFSVMLKEKVKRLWSQASPRKVSGRLFEKQTKSKNTGGVTQVVASVRP